MMDWVIIPPSWYAGSALVGFAVLLGISKLLQLATRAWDRPLSLLEAAALLVPAAPMALASLLAPLAALPLWVAALSGGVGLVLQRKSARQSNKLNELSMVWFVALAITAVIPWFGSDTERGAGHPVFMALYLGPLVVSAGVTFRLRVREDE